MKKLKITINNVTYMVSVEEVRDSALPAIEAQAVPNRHFSSKPSILPLPVKVIPNTVKAGGNNITAPMPGVVLAVNVNVGDTVKVGDVVAVLEAMKMENDISAKREGIVKEVKVEEGQTVGGGEVLVVTG